MEYLLQSFDYAFSDAQIIKTPFDRIMIWKGYERKRQ